MVQAASKEQELVSAAAPVPRSEMLLDTDGDAAAERILALLAKDLYLPARELAVLAAERFPDDSKLQKILRVFDNRGKAWVASGGPGPGRAAEFAWLRNPPDWARGKWVALSGREVVAFGDTLEEVAASVRSQKLSKHPLVHRID
jgi:predicted NAD/FAD-dependent oxidoreductase